MLLSYKPLHLEAQQRLQEEGCVLDISTHLPPGTLAPLLPAPSWICASSSRRWNQWKGVRCSVHGEDVDLGAREEDTTSEELQCHI